MEGSGPGLCWSRRRVPGVQKHELYAWYLVHEFRALLSTCFVFRGATVILRPAILSTSRTGSHGQGSGKISIAAKLFGGLLECLRGNS